VTAQGLLVTLINQFEFDDMPSERAYDLLGFDSPGAYTQRLLKTPQNLVKRVFLIHPADEQMEWKAEGKHDMKRVLVRLLLLLCHATMVGNVLSLCIF
jgi:hypothetical protein